MSQVTPLNRDYPARNTAGQVTLSTPSVKCSVANDGAAPAQAALLRRGEGGDFAIAATFNLGAGPTPAVEVILPNQDPGTDYSVVVLNGTTSEIRAYVSGVDDTVAPSTGSATATLQSVGNASLASIDGKLTGVATAALQTAGNTSLATLAANSPALVAGRIPVDVTGLVSVSNFPTTFWQATQPVSGTFWQAVQPVSGSVSVSNFPASQAVTGTFWQATQPVSGTVSVTAPAVGTVPATTFLSMTTTGSQVWAAAPTAKSRKIYNPRSNAILYVVYFDGVNNVTSEATCGFTINPGQLWEMPSFNGLVEYTGIIRAALETGTGNINATQVT